MFICVLINLKIFLERLFWAKVLVTESEALVGSDGGQSKKISGVVMSRDGGAGGAAAV